MGPKICGHVGPTYTRTIHVGHVGPTYTRTIHVGHVGPTYGTAP